VASECQQVLRACIHVQDAATSRPEAQVPPHPCTVRQCERHRCKLLDALGTLTDPLQQRLIVRQGTMTAKWLHDHRCVVNPPNGLPERSYFDRALTMVDVLGGLTVKV